MHKNKLLTQSHASHGPWSFILSETCFESDLCSSIFHPTQLPLKSLLTSSNTHLSERTGSLTARPARGRELHRTHRGAATANGNRPYSRRSWQSAREPPGLGRVTFGAFAATRERGVNGARRGFTRRGCSAARCESEDAGGRPMRVMAGEAERESFERGGNRVTLNCR